MKYILKLLLLFSILIYLNGCSTPIQPSLPRNTQKTVTKAQQAGFHLVRYATKSFILTAYEHLPPNTNELVYVYIEGDGHSWVRKYRLSPNPTPRQPLALTLALHDPHSHVVYLARPCQYTPLDLDQKCDPKYWSSHRYAPEVITSNNEVLDAIKLKTKNSKFVLIGFSGGASVATLLASERNDIAGLITVCGDLNHNALNQYHHTTLMPQSLNPTHVTHLLHHIPQQHWSGEKDRIVPSWVAKDFTQKVNTPHCKHYILKDASHHKGWEEKWVDIIKNFPT